MSSSKKTLITTKVKQNKDDEVVLTRYDQNLDSCIEKGYSNDAFKGDEMTDNALETGTIDEGID